MSEREMGFKNIFSFLSPLLSFVPPLYRDLHLTCLYWTLDWYFSVRFLDLRRLHIILKDGKERSRGECLYNLLSVIPFRDLGRNDM